MTSLTWNRVAGLTISALLLNMAIGGWLFAARWYLTPPLFDYTPTLYVLAWLVVPAACLLLRPHGPIGRFLWLSPLIVLLFLVYLTLVGPATGYTPADCRPVSPAERPVRYECTTRISSTGSTTSFKLVGPAGLPIVHIVDVRDTDSQRMMTNSKKRS